MKSELGLMAILGVTGCSQPVSQQDTDKPVSAIVKEALEVCEGKSRTLDENPKRPETYTRSDFDQCMAAQANKSKPANAEICAAANGDMGNEGTNAAECLLIIA